MSKEAIKEETFLLDSGKRFKKLDFSRLPWPEIRSRIGNTEWGPLEVLSKENVTAEVSKEAPVISTHQCTIAKYLTPSL